MLAEWKNTALPSKSEVEGAIAGIEHVLPGCRMSARGHGRLGAGEILPEALGLRPSELLGIVGDDVMLPEDRACEVLMPAVIGLGICSEHPSETACLPSS